MASKNTRDAYWRANIRTVGPMLAVWFIVSIVISLVLVEPLNEWFRLGGFPFGFWFAQQGCIVVFIVLVFFYARRMERLDKQFEEKAKRESDEEGGA